MAWWPTSVSTSTAKKNVGNWNITFPISVSTGVHQPKTGDPVECILLTCDICAARHAGSVDANVLNGSGQYSWVRGKATKAPEKAGTHQRSQEHKEAVAFLQVASDQAANAPQLSAVVARSIQNADVLWEPGILHTLILS